MWLRSAFAVAQIGLSVLLVTTAARLGETFLELYRRQLLFRVAQVVTAKVPFNWTTPNERLFDSEPPALSNGSPPCPASPRWG